MPYDSVWEENALEILRQLKFLMQATDIFPKDNVRVIGNFTQWKPRRETYPNCLIRMVSDRVGFATADEEQHVFIVELLASLKSTARQVEDYDVVERENEDFLEMIGQIDEAIRGDNTLSGQANWALIRNKDLTYGFSEGYLFYSCLLQLEIQYVW